MNDWTEPDALAALATVPGVGPASLQALRDRYGSLAVAAGQPLSELADAAAAAFVGARRALEALGDLREHLGSVRERAARAGATLITAEDAAWPARLQELQADEAASQAPAALWARGSLSPLEGRFSVAVVGSRRPDPLARAQAAELGREAAAAGAVVVSGGATGVDTVAHRAALEAGGSTVAVLGTGIDVPYPRGNRALFEAIAESGALVTEYPPATQPFGGLFPRRNRIISALADIVVVVAATDASGSLSTANHAISQDRLVATYPGDPRRRLSGGCNRLLVRGAQAILEPADALEYLVEIFGAERDGGRVQEWLGARRRRASGGAVALGGQFPLSAPARVLLERLEGEPRGPDALAVGTGLSGAQIASALTELELPGLAERVGGGYVLAGIRGGRMDGSENA